MSTAITYDEIQALYLGLLDRPANASGETFWYGNGTASSTSVANGIGSYAKYYSNDNPLTGTAATISSTNITGEIQNIYTNLLGYTPAANNSGVLYWSNLFDTNKLTVGGIVDSIYNIVEGLKGNTSSPYYNEYTTMTSRIASATSYTQANANVAYSSSAYLTEGQSIITSAAAPTIFNLTTGIDNIAPVGNSEIYGTIQSSGGTYSGTVNSFDTIKATGADNTLNISGTIAAAVDTKTGATIGSFNVTGVQVANIQSTNKFSVDTTSWTGLNTLNITDNGNTNVNASTGTKGTAVTIADATGTITANGGTTVSITTLGIGAVIVGSSSAPTGAVTVKDTGGTGTIIIDGGASANITSTATAVNPVNVSGVTGTTTVHQSGVTLTAANSVLGGTGATFITTGGSGGTTKGTSITLGGTGYHQVISGNATLTDTMSGPNVDKFTVLATGAVNINTTADSGNITVGSATNAALDPTGAVTIVNETATSSGYYYGTSLTDVYVNGAPSVSITGGDALASFVTDESKTNALKTVSLTGISGNVTLSSSALANVTIDNSLKSFGTKATTVTVNNSTTGHTLNLTLNGDTNAATALTDDKASTINVTASGASNYITLTDTLNPASGLTYSFTNNGTGTLNVATASIANGSNGDKINVAGNGAVALGNLSAKTHLTSITGTGAGAVTATISGQVTNFSGGSGANVIGVTSTASLTHNINGGTGGNNTVIETSATGDYKPALGATGLTNFQNLELGAGATGTYNTTQGSDHFTGNLINDQGSHAVTFSSVATTNQVVLALTNPATKAVTILPTSQTVATNTLHLDINTPSGTLAVSANAIVKSENTISIDSVKNASSSANTLAISDHTTLGNKADAAQTINITGGGNLTLTYAATANATAISTINASTSTGKVSVTGVATSTKGVTIKGGSGKLTAQGATATTSTKAKDTITVGSGGGTITLGYGGAGYEANNATGSETVNLSSGAVASTIITSADTAKGDQNVTINGFNVSTSTKTSDVIQFAEAKTAVATTTATQQSVGADKYTVSNGVITFTGADTLAQEIKDAYTIVDTASNQVAAFNTGTGSAYVVASGKTTHTAATATILDLKGVTGITQMGGTTAAADNIASSNVTGSAGAGYDTNATKTIDDTGHSTQVIGGATVFTAAVGVTVNNLAQSAIVTVENTNTTTASILGSLTTTQVGTAGDNSLTLNLSTDKAASTITIDTVTAIGDNALTINAIHTGTASLHAIGSLVDSGNTLASLTIGGTDALSINGIQDTALNTINITDAGVVTLGATTALNQTLNITDTAGVANLHLSGAGDTVSLGAAVTDTITASGKGLTLTTTVAGTVLDVKGATATNATVTMYSNSVTHTSNAGNNTIKVGANSHVTLGTAAQTTANTITAGASSVITLDKHVGTDGVATTITITGDTTGAPSSGLYQMTTINNAADNATTTHGANIIAALGGTANHATVAAINVASATTSLSAALDIAAKEDGGVAGMAYVDWFQYGGNTYVFEHVGAAENAMSSNDYVVKLTGIVDLTKFAIVNNTGVIHL